jgi:WD40 repeat protein
VKDSYHAFISYGFDTDAVLAEALHNGLQRLAKPWHRAVALDVFRDATGMSANPDLLGELKKALARSRFLVLLASPDSAQSPWVNNEIRDFLAKDADAWKRLLVVVTDGVWQWAGNGTYTADSTAVPEALVGVFKAEILFVDLRWARGMTDLTLAVPRFKAAVVDIAAPIHGKSEDDLIGEDVRQFRLAKRLRWSAVAGLSVLLVASLIASAVAVGKGREAVRQRNAARAQTEIAVAAEATAKTERDRAEAATAEALESAAIARSGELASSALAVNDDPEVAALLAVESLYPNGETEPRRSPQADNAVGITSRALLSRVFVPGDALPGMTSAITIATVGRFIATISPPTAFAVCPYADGIGGSGDTGVTSPITWWDRDRGEPLVGVPPGVELPVSFMNVGSIVVRIDDERAITPIAGRVLVVSGDRADSDGLLPTPGTCSGRGSPATYHAATDTLVAFDEAAGSFVATNATSGLEIGRMSSPGVTDWRDVAVADRRVFAAEPDGKVSVWPLDGGGTVGAAAPFSSSWLGSDGGWVAGSSSAARLEFSTGGGTTVVTVEGGMSSVTDVTFSSDQRFLAETDGTDVEIWQLTGASAVSVASLPSSSVRSLFWSGHELAVASARGTEFYAFREQQLIADIASVALSADGSVLAGKGEDSPTVEVFDAHAPFAGPSGKVVVDDSYTEVTGLSPDGSLLVTSGNDLVVHDVASGVSLFSQPSATATFDPSGRWLAVQSFSFGPGTPDALRIIDTVDWTVLASFPYAEAALLNVVWVGDDRLLLVESDGRVRSVELTEGVWKAGDVELPSAAGGLWAAPGLGFVALADLAGRLDFWTLPDDASQLPELIGRKVIATTWISFIAFSADPDHLQMITVAGREMVLWDMADPRNPRRVEPLDRLPTFAAAGRWGLWRGAPVAFAADGRSIFVNTGGAMAVLPAFDLQATCAEVDQDAIRRAEAIIGDKSACTRIAELRAAG